MRGQTALEVARIEAVAETQSAKVDAVAEVTTRAMTNIALVSQLEQQLVQMVPLSCSRLQALGDIGALATAEVLTDTTRRLKR
jgi:hypothetical protein